LSFFYLLPFFCCGQFPPDSGKTASFPEYPAPGLPEDGRNVKERILFLVTGE
jgi:hypothetical protein